MTPAEDLRVRIRDARKHGAFNGGSALITELAILEPSGRQTLDGRPIPVGFDVLTYITIATRNTPEIVEHLIVPEDELHDT